VSVVLHPHLSSLRNRFLILRLISMEYSTAITLHNPYVDFSDSQSTSASRCVHSARAILTAYYRLYETSLDISRLHPLVVVGICSSPLMSRSSFYFQICWYLAAVVQIQLCKYFIEIGDVSRETTIWGEINILRCVLTLLRQPPRHSHIPEARHNAQPQLHTCFCLTPFLLM